MSSSVILATSIAPELGASISGGSVDDSGWVGFASEACGVGLWFGRNEMDGFDSRIKSEFMTSNVCLERGRSNGTLCDII